jgi:hypothetical protein
LAERASLIVAGIEPAPSSLHGIYASVELAKLALLASSGLYALKPRG